MEILKRTQGIDFKAKNSSLVGLAEVVLKDATTGKVKEVVKQKNMLTNALTSLANKVPFNLNDSAIYRAVAGGGAYADDLIGYTPIIDKALGGVIVYPTALGNDPDLLYLPFSTHTPTGYAGKETYTQDDPKQGVYDAVSSGTITNGYRHVFTWGSAYGNGVIASVALSNSKCYKYFNDYATMIGSGSGTSFYISNMNAIVPPESRITSSTIIGVNTRGVYLRSSTNKVIFTPLPMTKVDLLIDYKQPFTARRELNYTIPSNSFLCLGEDELHIFTITSASVSSTSITHTVLDLDDETTTDTTFTVAAYITSASRLLGVCAMRDGYVYMPKYGNTSSGGSIYKINLSDATDVTELTSTSNMTYSYNFWNVGGMIMGLWFNIGDDDVIRPVENNCNIFPIYRKGVWVVKAVLPTSQWSNDDFTGIAVDVLHPYCATHADLENAVNKTADKQMVVNYSVVQV